MNRLSTLGARAAWDLPQVRTVAEPGYKGFEAITWFGILGPAGLSKDFVAKLNTDFNKAFQDPKLKKESSDQVTDVQGSSTDNFAKLISGT